MLSRLSSIRFNPRTPCGVRLVNGNGNNGQDVFQSTHSLRSATPVDAVGPMATVVSIHALLAECDACVLWSSFGITGFNPRTPCGVRRTGRNCWCLQSRFQSTHSLRSATRVTGDEKVSCHVSIHALLAECDLRATMVSSQSRRFNPRTPCGVRLLPSLVPPKNTSFNPRTPCGVRPALISGGQIRAWFQSTHSLRSATV